MKEIVVCGFMSTCPIAGVVWQHLHYLVGLKQLGFDPVYIEDTSRYPYNPETFDTGEAAIPHAARILNELAKRHHFRWAYRARFTDPMQTYGDLTDCQIGDTFANAEAVLNLCGAQEMHEEVLKSRCLAYIESDPGVEQIKLDQGNKATMAYLQSHHAHFSFGENLGQADCPLPLGPFQWKPTRQPVILDFWKKSRETTSHPLPQRRFTTIANWETKGKDIAWKNQVYYWSKTFEFLKFSDLPRQMDASRFVWEMATDMSRDPASKELFQRQGWQTVSPHPLSCDFDQYIEYIQQSDGEWTVAKDQYIRLKTGWFSDRSACYLAAGRPVITQDTLFGKFIPTGEGLFSFRTMEDIHRAAEAVASNYSHHSRKAAEIAEEYFSAKKVLAKMMSELGISSPA